LLPLFIAILGLSFRPGNTWSDVQIQEAMTLARTNPDRAISYVNEQGVTAYDFGRDLSNVGKLDLALDWYRALGKHTDDAQYLYGTAWTHWIRGETSLSLKAANYIINVSGGSSLVLARTHYLLALIYSGKRFICLARAEALQSLELYQELGKRGGQFNNMYVLTIIETYDRDFEKARQWLEQSRPLRHKNTSEAYLLELEGEIFFHEGEYENSLNFFLRAEEEFREQELPRNAVNALTKVGLLFLLTGNKEKGYETLTRIDTLVAEMNLYKYYLSNNASWILLYRCYGYDTFELTNEIQVWLDEPENDAGGSLQNLLEFVQNVPCPTFQ
jgi:tetratricopeptide (TPR) repeat protein